MKKCKACTQKNELCRNNIIPFSKYCIIHQDIGSWILGSIIGILVTFLAVIYQDREPNLNVLCDLSDNGNPSELHCEVINSGRAESRDVTVSFNNMLPKDTNVKAEPELNIVLLTSETILNPMFSPERAQIMTAFIIQIPRVSAEDTVKFTIHTTDIDNLRAAKQVMKIREQIKIVLTEFYTKVKEFYPIEAGEVIIDDILKERYKRENFFYPAKFSYENGRFPVKYINEKEEYAAALNEDLYKKHKKEFIDLFEDRPRFKAPVIRIITSEGESTTAAMPPYISTYIRGSVPLSELKEKGEMYIQIPVPDSYE